MIDGSVGIGDGSNSLQEWDDVGGQSCQQYFIT